MSFSLAACDGRGAQSFDSRLAVYPDGRVDLLMGKVELGQGIGTALAQIVADELGVEFGNINLISVDTDISPDESYTFSSISIQQSGPLVRAAAAQAREALADQNIDANSRKKSIGKPLQRIDIPNKIFGVETYIQDLRLPDMVHARVVRPASPRASLLSVNVNAGESLPGVLGVVRDGNFLAVVARREGQARHAASELGQSTEWELPNDLPDSTDVHRWLKSANSRLEVVSSKLSGDAPQSESAEYRATYQRPVLAHASISPSAAVALYKDGKLTVWSHAQGMFPLRDAIAHTIGLPLESVRCIHLEASGCYGHNGADDAACDAAAIAMRMPDTPIRLQWERADEFKWEPYGPAMHVEVEARLTAEGRISDWRYDLWSCPHASRPRGSSSAGHLLYAQLKENPLPLPEPFSIPQPSGGSDRNAVPKYVFGGHQVNKHFVTDTPIRGSSLRGLGAYGNVFAIESFMDELAQAARTDPFEFRIAHLEDDRAIAVLQRLRDETEWQERSGSGEGFGWGLGFAQFKNLSSYLGVVAKLRVETNGRIALERITAVCDAGLIINPDGVKAQIEGGIVQSASWTLKEQVAFSSKGILTQDWNSYPILRFDEVPQVDVTLIDRPDVKSLGVGETAQGPTAAAIANAVCHATGQRLRTLPLRPQAKKNPATFR